MEKREWWRAKPRRAAYCPLKAERSSFGRQFEAEPFGQSAARGFTSPLLERIQHDFKQIRLLQGHAIYEPGDQIDQIYFPQSGMISLLVVGKDGGAVETATIGREGAVGLHSALGKRVSFTRATIQISGKFSVIRAAAFTQSLQGHAAVRDLITRYTEVLWTEAQ